MSNRCPHAAFTWIVDIPVCLLATETGTSTVCGLPQHGHFKFSSFESTFLCHQGDFSGRFRCNIASLSRAPSHVFLNSQKGYVVMPQSFAFNFRRYFAALMDATAPSPTAMATWKPFPHASPQANTPSMLVCWFLSTMMFP